MKLQEATLLGIVGNTLFLGPFYGGDHEHTVTVDKITKGDLIHRGVQEYPNRDHIDAILHSMSYEEYLEALDRNNRQAEELPLSLEEKDSLPF